MLVSLLFNWLAEWTKKTFVSLIKTLLQELSSKKQNGKVQKSREERRDQLKRELMNHQ